MKRRDFSRVGERCREIGALSTSRAWGNGASGMGPWPPAEREDPGSTPGLTGTSQVQWLGLAAGDKKIPGAQGLRSLANLVGPG